LVFYAAIFGSAAWLYGVLGKAKSMIGTPEFGDPR
jgi:hypothetical protein